MSRQVPEDRALSDEDRAYLVQLGTRQSLIERLDADFPSGEEGEGEGSGGSSPSSPAYEEMGKDELLDELEKRKLSKSGTKADVIARLRESDAK